ncbi:hypothetical protein D0869_08480 [Hortaea werneckii]|uniref:Small nuclear ribonucleoprotein Prp3 C-terminal domain-containing protein n=1 Tax=Hortaea werneckii TaxID=91943 RepID=A0A3M7BHK8_HORWE|nr:hypothetical protein KC334_g11879 [Hortaea werneckii]KAI7004591.1 hypothetical protein KC355_g8643 [Hortaea werneckii]KAI7202149.1 hypothetical protein KC324_g1878 [Hortaea werneckii]KAI7592140.1 hypothetical protein KC316_g2465 [Hortaea werneckii]KAI7658142.1 hypothetical protein KC318_g11406 [Hortaea werneckii]
MANTQGVQNVLPKDMMAMQLGQIDLLMAMYAPDDAISMEDASIDLVETLRTWCDGIKDDPPTFADSGISILLTLTLSDIEDHEGTDPRSLQLSLTVPLTYQEQLGVDPPTIKARLQQPQWMTKAQVSQINTDLPDEDILTVIEHVKEAVLEHAVQATHAPSEAQELFDSQAPIVRAWFYFPSISTRAKRDDLINFAPTYGLTGFLMAGKPGILCLEGGSTAIDDFMKFIKTDSWGDIPSQHKKVSERYRQTEADLVRVFDGMEEITETVGERRGERANRSDMKALEMWLIERGLGDAFSNVFM